MIKISQMIRYLIISLMLVGSLQAEEGRADVSPQNISIKIESFEGGLLQSLPAKDVKLVPLGDARMKSGFRDGGEWSLKRLSPNDFLKSWVPVSGNTGVYIQIPVFQLEVKEEPGRFFRVLEPSIQLASGESQQVIAVLRESERLIIQQEEKINSIIQSLEELLSSFEQ